MTGRTQDILVATILLVLSCVWIWLVTTTIRTGFGGGDIGPRAFPLTLGVALAGLSLLLLVRCYLAGNGPAEHSGDADSPHFNVVPALVVLGEILLYGFLLQKVGFLLATTAIVLFIMLFSLRLRSLKMIIGVTLGVPVGAWLIFEKLLGIYLANGSLLNLG